jgi:hypothetical protein
VELLPRDAATGPYMQLQLVRIYLLVGEPEKALDQLEPLLKIAYYLSPAGFGSIPPSIRCGATPGLPGPRVRAPDGGALFASGGTVPRMLLRLWICPLAASQPDGAITTSRRQKL